MPAHPARHLTLAPLRSCARSARRQTANSLGRSASEINTGALRFCERHGFTQTAKLDDLARDGRAEILMRKPL